MCIASKSSMSSVVSVMYWTARNSNFAGDRKNGRFGNLAILFVYIQPRLHFNSARHSTWLEVKQYFQC